MKTMVQHTVVETLNDPSELAVIQGCCTAPVKGWTVTALQTQPSGVLGPPVPSQCCCPEDCTALVKQRR